MAVMRKQKLLAIICVATLVVAGAGTVHAEDNDAQAKAREALRKAMSETSNQPAAAPSAPATAPVRVVPAAAPAPVQPVPVPAVEVAPAPSKPQGLTPEQEEKLREAMRAEKARLDAADAAKMKQQQPAKPVVAVAPISKPEPKKVSVTAGKSSVNAQFILAPLPSSKEQKLHDLLELYKADKISPTEYHEQRAKILAE